MATASHCAGGAQLPSLPESILVGPREGQSRAQLSRSKRHSGEGFDKTPIVKQLRVTALGGGRGSFLLEMGGQRLLINPCLSDKSEITPQNAHEKADFVILTSARDGIFDSATLEGMKLMSVDFVASEAAGEPLGRMMVKNMAVLAPGPLGRTLLQGANGSADIGVLVTPGTSAMPWQPTELGFIFVNMDTGVAVGYEAQGLFLGEDAASTRDGIPEEAYQIDYLITPDLRNTAGVTKGLTERGAILNGVVHLPQSDGSEAKAEETGFNFLNALDGAVDKALGGIDDDPEMFKEFLQKQGKALANVRLLQPVVGGGPVDLQ